MKHCVQMTSSQCGPSVISYAVCARGSCQDRSGILNKQAACRGEDTQTCDHQVDLEQLKQLQAQEFVAALTSMELG